MDPQESRLWKLFVNMCLAVLILMVLGDLVAEEYMDEEIGRDAIEIVELFLSLILLTDISISFIKARDRKAFLKKNFIKIIAVFPWGALFRGLALLRIETEIPMIGEALVLESEALAAQRVAGGAGKGFRLFAKLKELFE